MAQEIVWSREAVNDLESIAEFISKDSEFYASALVQEVLDAGDSLAELYERGRVLPELGNKSIREIFIKDYRLIYSIEISRVVILGLIHGKRDLNTLLKKKK